MKRPTPRRVADVTEALCRRPVAPELVDQAFETFLATGQLPDEPWFAAQVVDQLKPTMNRHLGRNFIDWAKQLCAEFERPKDPVRDRLIHEAVWETGVFRMAARCMLEGLVSAGFDPRQPIFDGMELPEFGTVGMALLGVPERLVGPEHEAQGQRLTERLEAMARAIPHHNRRWWLELHNAAQMFQHDGERPADPMVLDCVLALGELSTFLDQVAGASVDEELAAFDAASQATGADRERAIERLQAMAVAGRFVREVA